YQRLDGAELTDVDHPESDRVNLRQQCPPLVEQFLLERQPVSREFVEQRRRSSPPAGGILPADARAGRRIWWRRPRRAGNNRRRSRRTRWTRWTRPVAVC